ncbi:MAG: cell division protein ZapA [Croceibacterium sp.]
MSNITLDIAGRKFTVACAEGEEAHIAMLGRTIDAKLADMPHIANQSEARALLFAALLLADENYEMKQGGGTPATSGPDVAEDLEALAGRLESLASQLEGAD